jgi:DNA invertase Pin-like site-specific DNA recombinase
LVEYFRMSPVTVPRAKARSQLRAVQYVRMSTEHQQYSPIVQKNAIAEYAAAHHIHIVGTYEDAGISGLTLRERQGLMRLLVDVQSSTRRFSTVLVYDVSRWGRFQDVDESAYYEYLCRKAGVQVIYIAEPFDNDGTPITCIFKAVKRAMAGEFSRELSRKVYLGHCLGAQRGLHEGGPPGYGIRRLLLDPDSNVKSVLQRYEYKNLQNDRTRKTPGPVHEVALVHRMFEWYAGGRVTFATIARRLNDFGLYNGLGHPWQASNIRQILTNEKYTGTNLYGRTSLKLHAGWQAMPESEWIRVPGAFEPVVDRHLFNAVQLRRVQSRRQPTKDEVKAGLERLLARTGHLSQAVLKSHLRAPTVDQVMKHFGSLLEAYDAVGYEPTMGSERYDIRRSAAARHNRRAARAAGRPSADAVCAVSTSRHRSSACVPFPSPDGYRDTRTASRAPVSDQNRHSGPG